MRYIVAAAVMAVGVLAFACVRILGVEEIHLGRVEVFQPAAHIFVGMLFGAWVQSRLSGLEDRYPLLLALLLSGVELICFLFGSRP